METPSKFVGYVCETEGGQLVKKEFEAPAMNKDDIVIKVEYCGLCYSDVHLICNNWGYTEYPLVPGHEVVGQVVAVGSDVTHLRKGQRVGVGWTSKSCHNCANCTAGNDQYCKNSEGTIVGRPGGFADHIVVRGSWAFPLPDAIPSSAAGPLMCGGSTVYTPFKIYGITGPQSVGVYGIGGLGHLALQFAKGFGCEVTAISNSADKEEESKKFGASKFVNMTNPEHFKKAYNSLDALLITGDAGDWEKLASFLKFDGKMIFLGAGTSAITLPVSTIQSKRLTITGCYTGPRANIAEMLRFAAVNGVKPQVQEFPFDKVNEGIEFLKAGKARYRVVFKH